MALILAALFIIVPIAEIYLLIEVGGLLGTLPTIAIVVTTAILGAALARRQGLAVLTTLQRSMATGREVGNSLVEAGLVLAAAVTLLTPGFMTDIAGLALLVPLVRRPVAALCARHLARRLAERAAVHVHQHVVMGGGFGPNVPPRDRAHTDRDDYDPPPPGVIDV